MGWPVMRSCFWLASCAVLLVLSGCGVITSVPQYATQGPTAFAPAVVPVTPPMPARSVQRPTPEHPQPSLTSPPTVVAALTPPPKAISEPHTPSPRQPTRLEPFLAELAAAYRAQDRDRLAALSNHPHVDLAAGTVRVILELDRDPQARPGTPTVEIITTESGQRVEIQHAPPVAIRADLAAAIAATGATYETANGDLVQVLAPFASLEALAALPDVRLVRLPFPAGPLSR